MIKLNVNQTKEAFDICATLEMKYKKLRYKRFDNVLSVHHNDKIIYVIVIRDWMNKLASYHGYSTHSIISHSNPNYFLRTQIEYHGKPS